MPRARPRRHSQPSAGEVQIPDKVYFRIGEVSRLAKVKAYVLRYWETEFPSLRPTKTKTGHRLYRRKDVETVLNIKKLLYEQGFTIEGARRQIGHRQERKLPPPQRTLFDLNVDAGKLAEVRSGLEGILTMLSRKC